MRDLFIEGLIIRQILEDSPEGEARIESDWLFFPELKTLGESPEKLRRLQEALLLELLEDSEPDELPQRIIPDVEIEKKSISIKMESPLDLPLWGSSLELTFPYLIWEQNRMRIAFVPALGIEIPVKFSKEKDQSEEEIIEDQIHFAIARRRINRHLFDLSLLQRCSSLDLDRFTWNSYPLSPRERLMKEEGEDGAVVPVLKEVGKRLDNGKPDPVFEREKEIEQISSYLKGRRGAASILIVGENGVGKTAIVQNIAIRLGELGLPEKEVYHTPGSRIVAGMSGFGEWQDRCRKMALEASGKKGKMIYFGNLLELLEVGQSSATSESVGSFFRPWLIRGQFVAVAECTPAQLALIEQKDPGMLEAFRQVKIDPSPGVTALKILKQVAALHKARVALSPAALKRIFSLHKRYAGYSAMPGRMLHFTRRLISQNQPVKKKDGARRVPPAEVTRMFALETGLPSFLLDDSVPFDLEKTTDWFKKRIKGQDDAVAHVVNTIAGIKARLSRPNRPLGSFLFVGPTGVGKTELAKTLAEYFYGSRDRLLRIDMSEYSAPGSSGRLASGGPGEPEGILTSKMRDQPFSVVLLDEFEKADASVFDLFLQVLGEARLTDGAGRLADFSNAMIILTSNLGAAGFRAVAPGFGATEGKLSDLAIDHFVEAAKKRFRPEFFNRIGRIVPFLPLDDASIREVIVREISKLDDRDGFKTKELTLLVDDEVVNALVEGGFDPRYGARPLKRIIEEKILKPVGEYLIEHPTISGGTLEVKSFNRQTDFLEFSYFPDSDGRGKSERASIKNWNERIPNLRRWYQILTNSHLVGELHSDVRRLERRVKAEPGPRDHEVLAHSRNLLERLHNDTAAIYQIEEKLLLTSFENASFTRLESDIESAPQWNNFCDLLRDTYQWVQKSSSSIMLVMTSDNNARLSEFAEVYRAVAREYQCQVKCGYYRMKPEPEDLDPKKEGVRKPYLPQDDEEIEALFSGRIPGNVAALVLEFHKQQIGLRFTLEYGVHQFIDPEGNKTHVRITGYDDEEMSIEQGYVADGTLLDRDFQNSSIRRLWDEKEYHMKDEIWGSSIDSGKIDPRELPSGFSMDSVHSLIELTLIDRALETVRSE